MKICLLVVGKTDDTQIQKLILNYCNRLVHYIDFNITIISDINNTKSLSKTQQKDKEGELILKQVNPSDIVFLLDEKGKQQTSLEFSKTLQKIMNTGIKRLVFVIGGAYGFSDDVREKFSQKLGLSRMTFSHQMIRLFFVEQLYRGFTILRGEPYHHN